MIIEIINENDFYQCINDSRFKATFVKFHAKWCPPCKAIRPLYVDLSYQHPDIQFLTVDIDSLRFLAAYNGVNSMPTFYVYKNGVKQDVIHGARPDQLIKLAKFYSTSPALNDFVVPPSSHRNELNFDNNFQTQRNQASFGPSRNDFLVNNDYESFKQKKEKNSYVDDFICDTNSYQDKYLDTVEPSSYKYHLGESSA